MICRDDNEKYEIRVYENAYSSWSVGTAGRAHSEPRFTDRSVTSTTVRHRHFSFANGTVSRIEFVVGSAGDLAFLEIVPELGMSLRGHHKG